MKQSHKALAFYGYIVYRIESVSRPSSDVVGNIVSRCIDDRNNSEHRRHTVTRVTSEITVCGVASSCKLYK